MVEESSKVRRMYNRIVSWLSFAGAAWTVLIMILIVLDVLGRALFNQSIIGTPEIVRNSIVGITFLQITHVLREGRHIRTTVILERLSPKGKMVLNVFASLFGLILFSLLLFTAWEPTWEALRTGEYEGEGSLPVPTFPTRFLILVGCVFMIVQFAVSIYDELRPSKQSQNKGVNNDISM